MNEDMVRAALYAEVRGILERARTMPSQAALEQLAEEAADSLAEAVERAETRPLIEVYATQYPSHEQRTWGYTVSNGRTQGTSHLESQEAAIIDALRHELTPTVILRWIEPRGAAHG